MDCGRAFWAAGDWGRCCCACRCCINAFGVAAAPVVHDAAGFAAIVRRSHLHFKLTFTENTGWHKLHNQRAYPPPSRIPPHASRRLTHPPTYDKRTPRRRPPAGGEQGGSGITLLPTSVQGAAEHVQKGSGFEAAAPAARQVGARTDGHACRHAQHAAAWCYSVVSHSYLGAGSFLRVVYHGRNISWAFYVFDGHPRKLVF